MNINFRKIGALLLLLFSIFTLAACQNITEEVTVESIQVEISTLKPNYNVDDFDLSTISIRVTFSDGKFQIIPITESMLTEEHLSLLSNVGEHQITITYQGKSTTINLNLQYDSLKTQLMTLYTLSTTSGSFSGTYEEWLETVRGPQGNPGREVIFQVSNGYIQWQYTGDSSWTNLVELTSLVGPAGQDGVDGTDGKQVTFQVSEGFIQWQYVGDTTWTNLIDLQTITGADGSNGTDGVDGREVLFQVAEGYIQWKYDTDETWINLIEIASLTGSNGADGISISNTEINVNGELIVTFSDGNTQNLGKLFKPYVVQFVDFNGYVLNVQHVLHGHAATTPTSPERIGYTFNGWSVAFDNITDNLEVVATYTINTFEITFVSNGGTEYSNLTEVPYGTTVVLPIPIKTGFYFAGWYLDDTVNGYQFTNASLVQANITLYARWELQPYVVSFYDEYDDLIKREYVLYGGNAHAPEAPKLGYHVVGWDTDFTNITNNLDVRPIYEPNTDTPYTINYYKEAIGGITYELYESVIFYGTSDVLVDATFNTYEGFIFNANHVDNKLSGYVAVDGSLTLNLYYDRVQYDVHFYDNNNFVFETISAYHGQDITPPTAPDVLGYTFESWSETLINVTETKHVYSQYTPNQYVITLDVNSGDALDSDVLDVIFDDIVTGLVIPTRLGYTFVKWVDINDNEYQNGDLYQVAEDITLTAVWVANDASYSVNYYLENLDGTYALFETNTIDGATDLYVEAVLKSYIGYTVNTGHANNQLNGTVLSDDSLVLSVYYLREVYTVTFIDFDEAVISIDEVKYLGAATAPSNPERTGYTFSSWDISFNEITSNLTVIATYTINTYTLTFDVDGGEEISQQTENYNTLISLPTPTKDHYDFTGWLLNDVSVTEVYLTQDLTVVATWQLTDYAIVLNTNGGNALDDIVVQYGTVISTLPTPTRTDYTFDGWTLDSNPVTLPYTFLSSADIELVAVWIGLSEGISYEINNEEVTILSYSGSETDLIIPDTIAGLPVTTIGTGAFSGNTTIESLTLGQYVTAIQAQAFYQMTSLTYLELPASAQSFGTQILFGSNSLEHLVLSSESNYQLRYYFGNNINFIPNTLNTLEFSEGSQSINITLTQSNLGSITNIIIPNSITEIPTETFTGASSLTSIVIPNSVTSIGSNAFYGASSLTSIVIPNSVTSIGDSAFRGASSLTSIVIPNSVTSIGSSAFINTGLTLIYTSISSKPTNWNSNWVSNDVTVVWGYEQTVENDGILYALSTQGVAYVIGTNESMTSNVLVLDYINGYEVIEIANSAFKDNLVIETIYIPNTIVKIGYQAFYGATNFNLVEFETYSQLEHIEAYAFGNLANLEAIIIPISVYIIKNNAFANTTDLIIYVYHTTKPLGWEVNWNPNNLNVVWSYNE